VTLTRTVADEANPQTEPHRFAKKTFWRYETALSALPNGLFRKPKQPISGCCLVCPCKQLIHNRLHACAFLRHKTSRHSLPFAFFLRIINVFPPVQNILLRHAQQPSRFLFTKEARHHTLLIRQHKKSEKNRFGIQDIPERCILLLSAQ